MNYKNIHDKLVEYCRSVDAKNRLLKRNPSDLRLSERFLYVEIHHIIPKSLGGFDESSNLVELLPEEHLFIHMLRYKIYKKREDMLAVRFMLNGYDNSGNHKGNVKTIITKKIRMGYAWLRSHAQELRRNEGWHTPEGIKNISVARKGTMPVKDLKTGQIIGSFPVDHPKILSGEWVHHTKGRKQSKSEVENKRKLFQGQNNPNASGLSEDFFLKKGVEAFTRFGYILSWDAMLKLSEVENFPWIKSLSSRFNGRGVIGYYSEMESLTGAKYDPHHTRRKKYVKN